MLLSVLLIGALVPLYVLGLRLPSVGMFHDDGVYAVTAKALAEGRGYRIISLPDEPRQTKYPPVFPLLLAAVWKMTSEFPANLAVLKLVPLVGAIVWLLLTLRLYRTLGIPQPLRLAAVAAIASVTWVLDLSVTLLSETVFAALFTAALLCLETERRSDTQAPSTARVVAAAILAALATLTRTVGFSLVIAGVGWLLFTRRDARRAGLFAAVAAMVLLPWLLWSAVSSNGGYYSASNYIGWNVLTFAPEVTLVQRARVVALNLLWAGVSPAMLFELPTGPAAVMITLFVLALGTVGLGRPYRVSLWFLALYLLLILGWAWPPQRFVVVVLPLLLWPVLALASRSAVAMSGATAVVLVMAGHTASVLRGHVHEGAQKGRLEFGVADIEGWDEVVAATAWIRNHTSPDERLLGNLDPLYYLLTGRKAVRGFDANPFLLRYSQDGTGALGDADRMLSEIRRSRATLIVDSHDALFAERPYLNALYDELEQRGDIVFVESVGRFRFFRPKIDPEPEPTPSPGSPIHPPDSARPTP